ncbi:hypothetical protein ES703_112377 [subsurface metagenome]
MSTGKRPPEPSKAAKAKDPPTRVDELLKQFEGDRKRAAITMLTEGYNTVEIGTAFKTATTKGISGRTWEKWKKEADLIQKLGPDAAAVVEQREKVFETETLARFKTMTNESQTRILSFGMYVSDVVTPQVPAATSKDKEKNTIKWLSRAVEAFQPEKMEEIEKFGATAFWAALELKRQMIVVMNWAEPSKRLENLAEKALYSPNPINTEAFRLLLNELMTTIRAVPRFTRGPKLEEVPGIIKAYASARGISEEAAEQRMETVIKEVA